MALDKSKWVYKEPTTPLRVPTAPIGPVNPFLKTPIPGNQQLQTDIVNQNPNPNGIPTRRLTPPPATANVSANASAQSQIAQQINTAIAANSTTDTDYIGINKQAGTTYTIQPSDFDTLISCDNNSGGTIELPLVGTSTYPTTKYVQSVYRALPFSVTSGTKYSAVPLINTAGNTLLVYVAYFADTPEPTVTVTDSQNNTYFPIGTTQYPAGGSYGISALFVASNIANGSNTVSVSFNQTWGPEPFDGVFVVGEYTGVPVAIGPIETSAYKDAESPADTGPNAVSLTTINPGDVIVSFLSGYTELSTITPPVAAVFRQGSGTGGAAYWGYYDSTITSPSTVNYSYAFTFVSYSYTIQMAVVLKNLGALPSIDIPKGWYCYIQNTGTGTFTLNPNVTIGITIDGSTTPVSIGSDQGLLLIFDGFNWVTERGIGSGGNSGSNITSQNTTYTAKDGDFVLCDTSSAGFTVTLPASSASKGKSISVKKVSTDSNTLTVAGGGSDTIDGNASILIAFQNTCMDVTADGIATWWNF